MNFIFNFKIGPAALAFASVAGILARGGMALAEGESVTRLAALVDYVAADYPGAVRDGKILAATEYEEQRGMVADARALAAGLGSATVSAGVDAIAQAVERRGTPEEVAAACRLVRARLVSDLGLVLAPSSPPSRERGRALFATNCVPCHGAGGRGDGPRAASLNPRPVSFLDPERIARISPQLAFHALTFGVKGTAMAAFDGLPAADRWSLAFHVIALRHDGGPVEEGRRRFAEARPLIAATASKLAELSDEELDRALTASMPDPSARSAAIVWLREDATFAERPGGQFAEARRRLAPIAATYAAPSPDAAATAHDLALAAYLDGIEPHEAALRARDPQLTLRIENGFLELRRAIDERAPPETVGKRVGALTLLLDRAEERPAGAGVAFVAALTIALREGLEAALLIAALLAFLRKSGHGDRARLVHLGWLAAIPFGLASWWVAGALVAGARRELVEAVVTLAAAAMILLVSHWVLGAREARRWVGFLQRRVMALAPGQSGWPLFGLAFFAAGREAFEVVLFYRALLLDAGDQPGAVALGAGAGALGILAVVFVLGRLGRRLNPRPVMLASSVLLAALSVALVGRGIRALQEGAYLSLSPLALPDLSVLGLYPSVEGLAAQAGVLIALFLPRVHRRSTERGVPRGDRPAAESRSAEGS